VVLETFNKAMKMGIEVTSWLLSKIPKGSMIKKFFESQINGIKINRF
jgi:hypothetical protein